MQLTSSTVLGMSSNSNGSPANNLVAATAQRAARGSATDRRPPLAPTVLPVRTPAGFRFMPPISHIATSRGSSSKGICPDSSVSAISELEAMPANIGGSRVVNGVRVDVGSVQRPAAVLKDRLSPFGRVHVTTSVPSLIAVLAKQSFLGVDNPNLAQPEPIAVIPESKLRALLMKALAWFINRECTSLDGAVVVFVGKRGPGNAHTTRLALPLAAVHKLADEFSMAGGDQDFDLEIEEYGAHPFRAGNFYVEHSRWAVPIAGILGIMGLCVLVFLYAFLRDVVMLLMVSPPVM